MIPFLHYKIIEKKDRLVVGRGGEEVCLAVKEQHQGFCDDANVLYVDCINVHVVVVLC